MATRGSGHLTRLTTLLTLLETFTRVTDPLTAVTATGEGLPALSAAGDSLHQAGNILTILVAAVTELGGERGTRGAVLLAVTRVGDGVVTRVPPPAGLPTLRGLGAAVHRGIDHTGPTLATQLVKTHIGTPLTVPRVTKVLTVMQPAGQELVTDEGAGVVQPDAALIAALVTATAPPLLTSPAAPGVISPGGQLGAGDLLVHGAAPAPHLGHKVAG